MTPESLAQRWRTDAGGALVQRVLDSLSANKPLAPALSDLSGADEVEGEDLRGIDLRETNLRGADLAFVRLDFAQLDGCDLTGAQLQNASLIGASLAGVKARSALLTGANATEARFDGADLENADLSSCTLTGASFRTASLRGANFSRSVLTAAKLAGADLRGADLYLAEGIRRKAAPRSLKHRPAPHPKAASARGKAMTKAQIVAALADKVDIPRKMSAEILEALAELAHKEAKHGFTIPGIGKLVAAKRKARAGRNPQTGEAIKIPARKHPKSTRGKAGRRRGAGS